MKRIVILSMVVLAVMLQAGRQIATDLHTAKAWADGRIVEYADSVRPRAVIEKQADQEVMQQPVQVNVQAKPSAMPRKLTLPPGQDPAVIETVRAANRVLAANLPKTKGIN